MSTPKTVIGFDSWTVGSHHFARLVPSFEQLGYRLILLHIGSWGHDPNRPAEEKIGNLLVRDIAYYGRKSFGEILQVENPSAVLFLSTRAFAHMAFNRYARHMGIPTCHLYHGIVGVQAFAAGGADLDTNLLKRLVLARQRIGKNLKLLLPAYVKALRDTRAPLGYWKEFAWECLSKFKHVHPTSRLGDAMTDMGCVYIEADADHMARVYGLPPEHIFEVGNPDISSFGLGDSDLLSHRRGTERASAEVLYIETALLQVGSVFSSEEDFIDHLTHCRRVVEASGFRLVLKLHPATERTQLSERLEKLGFALCARDQFVSRLKDAAAAITEPSTAALIPALLGVPLLLCQLGRLHKQNYGAVLTDYPLSRQLQDQSNLDVLLSDIQADHNSDQLRAWLDGHAGPMPAHLMPDRVAAVIESLISAKEPPLPSALPI